MMDNKVLLKVLLKDLKYLGQLLFVVVLIAFLAKTDNMPTLVPKEYVKKIVEYTDKSMILFGIIKDPKVVQKYAEKKKTVKSAVKKDVPTRKDTDTGYKKYSKKSEAIKPNEAGARITILDRIYNFLLLNNYELNAIRELNKIGNTFNLYINNQLRKLDNIIDSSYVRNIIKEKELGIKNNESFLLVNNIISGFKHIDGLYIVNKDEKLVTSIDKGVKFKIDAKALIETLKKSGSSVKIYEFNNKSYFLYLIKNYQNSMNVLFLLEPEYFNSGLNNINILYKFFIFNRNHQVLNSNIDDGTLLAGLENAIAHKAISHKGEKYNIKFLKLKNVDLYIGIIFEKYPLIYMGLNILKFLFFIGILYLFYAGGRILVKKIKDLRIKQKPGMIETLANTMMEVVKSVKSTVDAQASARPVSVDRKDMEEVVDSVLSRYVEDDEDDRQREFAPVFKRKKRNINIKEVDGWKIIES